VGEITVDSRAEAEGVGGFIEVDEVRPSKKRRTRWIGDIS
jgi:hypothetical protein